MGKNNNGLTYALVGATCVTGLGALGYFLYTKKNQSSLVANANVKNLSKATTIKVLKQLKKEFFSSFQTMSMMAQSIKAQTRGKATDAEVKQFVLEHPQINEGLKSSEAKAYSKLNVTEQEFKNAVEFLFKDDAEVLQHKNEIKAMFDKAGSGVQLDIKTEIPQSLTSQNTIKILEQIMKESCRKMQEVFIKITEQGGEINMNDPQTIQALNQIKIDDVKTRILEEHGLEQYDDSGDKILSYATQKYSMDNTDGFQQQMMELELKQRKSMELIKQNPHDSTIIDKTFNEKITQPAGMGGGFGGMRPGGFQRTKKVEADGIETSKAKEVEKESSTKQVTEQEQPKQEEDKSSQKVATEEAEESEKLIKDQVSEKQVAQKEVVESEKQVVEGSEKQVVEESEKQVVEESEKQVVEESEKQVVVEESEQQVEQQEQVQQEEVKPEQDAEQKLEEEVEKVVEQQE